MKKTVNRYVNITLGVGLAIASFVLALTHNSVKASYLVNGEQKDNYQGTSFKCELPSVVIDGTLSMPFFPVTLHGICPWSEKTLVLSYVTFAISITFLILYGITVKTKSYHLAPLQFLLGFMSLGVLISTFTLMIIDLSQAWKHKDDNFKIPMFVVTGNQTVFLIHALLTLILIGINIYLIADVFRINRKNVNVSTIEETLVVDHENPFQRVPQK